MILLRYLKIWQDIELKIILLNYQNYYIRHSNTMSNAAENFDILVINLNVLYNYIFDDLTKLFSDLYLAKFLDFSKTISGFVGTLKMMSNAAKNFNNLVAGERST